MNEQLEPLNFPTFDFNIRNVGQSKQIFDFVRRRFVALTPEEWVRQNLLRFMTEQYRYPASLLAVEKQVKVNGLTQRADIVVHNRQGRPWLIAECKAPSVKVDQETFYQAARYNITLQVPYFLLSNGIMHFCLHLSGSEMVFMESLPEFPS